MGKGRKVGLIARRYADKSIAIEPWSDRCGRDRRKLSRCESGSVVDSTQSCEATGCLVALHLLSFRW